MKLLNGNLITAVIYFQSVSVSGDTRVFASTSQDCAFKSTDPYLGEWIAKFDGFGDLNAAAEVLHYFENDSNAEYSFCRDNTSTNNKMELKQLHGSIKDVRYRMCC